jgi:hypothetical protein
MEEITKKPEPLVDGEVTRGINKRTKEIEHFWCGIPHSLAVEVTGYTDMPWWNAEAYDDYAGLSSKLRRYFYRTGDTIDDLIEVMEWLRSEKQFDKADRLRTIIGRLARLRPDVAESESGSNRDKARGWK